MTFDIARSTARGYGRDRAGPDRELQQLIERLRQVPAAWPEAEAVATAYRTVVIGGGNAAGIGNGLDGINYEPFPLTLPAAYDPDVATVYPDGLGWGVLYTNGLIGPKVLIRHSFSGFAYPIISGNLARVAGTTGLTYDPGGGDPVVSMTAYLFDYV